MLNAIEQRRSIRKYKPDDISPEKVEEVIKAAILAPSWGNQQCVRWVVVRDSTLRQQLSELSQGVPPFISNPAKKALATAPIVLVAYADPSLSGKWNNIDYFLVDVGIALAHISLAAAHLALGTCIVGAFNESEVKKILNIPDNNRVIAMSPLGHPRKLPGQRSRKDLSDILKYM